MTAGQLAPHWPINEQAATLHPIGIAAEQAIFVKEGFFNVLPPVSVAAGAWGWIMKSSKTFTAVLGALALAMSLAVAE